MSNLDETTNQIDSKLTPTSTSGKPVKGLNGKPKSGSLLNQDPKSKGRQNVRRTEARKPVSDTELAGRVALGLQALADLSLSDRMKVLTGITAVHGLEITVKIQGANKAIKEGKPTSSAPEGKKKPLKPKKAPVAKLTDVQKEDEVVKECLAQILNEKSGLREAKGGPGTEGHQKAIAAAKLRLNARLVELQKNEAAASGISSAQTEEPSRGLDNSLSDH